MKHTLLGVPLANRNRIVWNILRSISGKMQMTTRSRDCKFDTLREVIKMLRNSRHASPSPSLSPSEVPPHTPPATARQFNALYAWVGTSQQTTDFSCILFNFFFCDKMLNLQISLRISHAESAA